MSSYIHCQESVYQFYNTAKCFPYVEIVICVRFYVEFGIIYKFS